MWGLTWVGFILTPKYHSKLKILVGDKHSSLSARVSVTTKKKFYNTDTRKPEYLKVRSNVDCRGTPIAKELEHPSF